MSCKVSLRDLPKKIPFDPPTPSLNDIFELGIAHLPAREWASLMALVPSRDPKMGQGPRKWTQINQGQLGGQFGFLSIYLGSL